MKNKILLVFTILFGLMMVNSGLNKLFNYIPVPELTPEQTAVFSAFSTIKWIFPFVAIIEILGGILIAIPKYRALGAIVILPVMAGIIAHHATHEPGTLLIPLIMLAINLWAIADNWPKYRYLIK